MAFAVPIALHLLATVVWVGGMLFAHVILRPAMTEALEPPARLRLFAAVFRRFFAWVWGAVAVLHATGWGIILGLYGGIGNAGLHVHVMLLLGTVMTLLFAALYFGPYRAFRDAVTHNDLARAPGHLAQVRVIVTVNLILGLATTVLGTAGAYWG